MIINNRTDLDNAPQEQRYRFLQMLAASTKRWQWDGAEWQLQTITRQLDRFDLTLDDLPAVPDPPKPGYDPDIQEREVELAQIQESRRFAYQRESDPIYMEYQRGEKTEQDWLDAVDAVKKRFPKPE